jgi:pimeloyl-ACP methyl ester carboxylesterase
MDLAFADEGPGPVVVLLHGFPVSKAMWDEQLKGLGSVYRVIAPDLRGFGRSRARSSLADCRWGDTWRYRWSRAIRPA